MIAPNAQGQAPSMTPVQAQQLTSYLYGLKTPQAVQQFAAQHQNDINVVGLASGVANAMKNASAPQQPVPQGTVAQAAIAGMAPQPQPQMQAPVPQAAPQPQATQQLPENSGIAQLPTQGIQSMAGGGIVGETEHFDAGGDVPLRSTTGGQSWTLDVPETIRNPNVPYYQQIPNPMYNTLGTTTFPSAEAATNAYRAAAPNIPQALPSNGMRPVMQADPRIINPAPTLAPDTAVVPTNKQGIADLAAQGRNLTGAPAPRPAARELSFADRLKAGMGENPDEDRFAKRREEINATAKAGAEEGLASLKTDLAAENAGMFKGREARLDKSEAALEKSKDTNLAMSLIKGGLSMIKGGPAMSAIAAGAMVGTEEYGKGIAQIKSAQEKLDEARDRMEDLRMNKNSMDNREIRAEQKGIRDLATQAQRDALAGSEKAYGIKREDMRAAVTSDVAVRQAELDRQSRLQIAGMPGDQQKMLSALGGGDIKKGMEIMTTIQAGKVSPLQMYEKYIQAFAGKDTTMAPPMNPQQYSTMINQFIAAQNPNKVPGAVDINTTSRP